MLKGDDMDVDLLLSVSDTMGPFGPCNADACSSSDFLSSPRLFSRVSHVVPWVVCSALAALAISFLAAAVALELDSLVFPEVNCSISFYAF